MLAATQACKPVKWSDLITELDIWADSGRQAAFWWRDDDATRPGPALDRLMAVTDGIPVALAVIPVSAESGLVDFISKNRSISILQHGYAHTNHAPAEEKKAEFGAHRPIPAMLAEIDAGHVRLSSLFGNRFLPIFVPPWNRIATSLVGQLSAGKTRYLSTFGRRDRHAALPYLNGHIDIINWRGDRGTLGVDLVLDTLISLLADIRLKSRDSAEPIGILTHHRDHDDKGWQFLAELLSVTRAHPGAGWISATEGLTGV